LVVKFTSDGDLPGGEGTRGVEWVIVVGGPGDPLRARNQWFSRHEKGGLVRSGGDFAYYALGS